MHAGTRIGAKLPQSAGLLAFELKAGGTSGGVSAAQSTVSASPASIAVGSGTSTITVTARDASGNPVSGATVVLAATGGGHTVTQPAVRRTPRAWSGSVGDAVRRARRLVRAARLCGRCPPATGGGVATCHAVVCFSERSDGCVVVVAVCGDL